MPGFDEEGSPFSRFDAGGGSAGGGFGGGGGGKGGLGRFSEGATNLPTKVPMHPGAYSQLYNTSNAAAMKAHMQALERAMNALLAKTPFTLRHETGYRALQQQWMRASEFFTGLSAHLRQVHPWSQ